jgi:hypothetical protein
LEEEGGPDGPYAWTGKMRKALQEQMFPKSYGNLQIDRKRSSFSPNLTEEEVYVVTFCLPYSASCLSTGSAQAEQEKSICWHITLTLQRFAHICVAPALVGHWQREELLPAHPQSTPAAIDA